MPNVFDQTLLRHKQRDFILDPSLVLCIPLCELDGRSFMSKDAYGHLCTVTGALWRPNGRWFDDTDDVITIPDANSLDVEAGMTVMCWINPSTVLNVAGAHGSVYFISKLNSFYLYWIGGVDGNFALYCKGTTPVEIKKAQNFLADTWYHIAGTFTTTGGVRVLYVNGEILKSEVGVTGDIDVTANPVLISDAAATMPGLIDDARLYNRALTPLEIQDNYLATKRRYAV